MAAPDSKTLDFLAGGGAMGSHIRAHPWGDTPLGSADSWPSGLRTALRILLTTQHPVFIFWGAEHYCFYNDAYSRSLGPEKHPSILGRPGREAWPEIWSIIGPQIEQVMRGDAATWHENQLIPIIRHGELQEVYWTYSYGPIDEPAAPNGVGGVLVLCTETTQHVLSERRMAAERERFAQLFEQAPTFMAVLRGPQHVIELANPGYMRLVGHRPVIGRKLAEALPEALEQGYVGILDKVFASGRAFRAEGARFILDDVSSAGVEERYLDFVYQPIKDADGTVTGIFVDGVDVTDRAVAEAALRDANTRKDEFLAMLAHELRNPLAPIRTAAEVLERRMLADVPARHAVDVVKRQATQLTRLVDDLLDVSRISMGRIELQREILLLSEVIDHAVEAVAPLWRAKNHQVSIVPSLEPLYVRGDSARLVQSFSNVMTNAAKFTEPGGQIRVSVTASDENVGVEISDTGAGIAPEYLPHVFELFSQADRTLDRSQGGLGIGLSVVKKLIEMHRGQVSARSAGLGQGTAFWIALPRAQPPSAQTRKVAAARKASRRVLIVDDNADAALSLSELLKLDGHDTLPVFSAEDALLEAEKFIPDVVLLDIGLPRMDGYEVARRLRSSPRCARTTLIALTGYGKPEDRSRAEAAGFHAHLVKPVDFLTLDKLLSASTESR